MANYSDSTLSNPLFKARMKAAERNDRIFSRAGVEQAIGISEDRLSRIESDLSVARPDEIVLMAELYHEPSLKNWYCRKCCPLGKDRPEVKDESIDRITIRLLASMENIERQRTRLLDMVKDGLISEDERPVLKDILDGLNDLAIGNLSLRNWIEKNMKDGEV